MSVPVLKLNDIAVYRGKDFGRRRANNDYVLRRWQTLELAEPGVYTLEGPNQSGKSVLIKLVMGVLPPRVRKEGGDFTIIEDKRVEIQHVEDAHKHGLVAIFQDDRLIASMTIKEQLLMRHASPGWVSMALMVRNFIAHNFFHKIFGAAPIHSPILERLTGHAEKLDLAKDVERRAIALLESYGSEYLAILNKYPRELSGGGVAVARLVSAQLTKNIRVLFLDEAFAGVQKEIWPRLVDNLKTWREENNATIVAVSHNTEELVRWQPIQRFSIIDGEICTIGVKGYRSLEPGLPIRVDAFPVFSPPYKEKWLEKASGPFLIIADERVKDHSVLNEISTLLTRWSGRTPRIISKPMSEERKTLKFYEELINEISPYFPRPEGALIIVGGGITLNSIGFAAATLHRGAIPVILVPTTVMAMADVAIGSKMSLNFEHSGKHYKNLLGLYSNPSCVLLDPRFLTTLSSEQRLLGLSECMKHGLLQDSTLFGNVVTLTKMSNPDPEGCFEAAVRTMHLKGQVLAKDPWELTIGRLLLYGHLHATSLERATNYAVPHGRAVYWGMLVDLYLAGPKDLYDNTLNIFKPFLGDMAEVVKGIGNDDMHAAYTCDTHFDVSRYHVIVVGDVGCFASLTGQDLRWKPVGWPDIRGAISKVSSDLISH